MPTSLLRRVPHSPPVCRTPRNRQDGSSTCPADFDLCSLGAAMLINADNLKGSTIIARDGAIGEIDDFYFDDESWTVRYLVVNTGAWLFRREVLVSPISIEKVGEANNQVLVNLTRDQVKDSPDIDTQKPVSRQHETAFMDYYGYPYYWG